MPPRVRDLTGRRPLWMLLILGLACLLAGGIPLVAHIAQARAARDTGSVPSSGAPFVDRLWTAAGAPAPAAVRRPAAAIPAPVRLRLPSLNVDAPVQPVQVGIDGSLGVPDDPRRLGWWPGSGRPGALSGSVVIDGHVDSAERGLGALFRLREAQPGEEISVENASGTTTRYTVVARRRYAKAALPVAELFAQGTRPRLVLITCGGRFDSATQHYDDNVVVYAVPR